MAVFLKFLTKFKGNEGYGWTEVHFRQSTSDNPNLQTQLNNYRSNIMPLRAALLGQGCAIVGTRVSYPRNGAIASYGLRDYVIGDEAQLSSAPALSLAVNFQDSTFTKSKVCHLRGFWDSVEENESYHPELPAAAGWTDRLTAWKEALIAGAYGWLSKDPALSAKGVGVTYVSAGNDIVTFTLPAPGMPLATVGTTQQIRFSGFNNANSVLNRQLLCEVLTQTSVRTVKSIASGPMNAPGRFNFRGIAFVGYAQTGSISLGERRMGRPLDRYPGRAKAKPLT